MNQNEFSLIVFQISIKKSYDKYYSIDEQELIIIHTKKNIENKYDIKIKDSDFYYILRYSNGIYR